MATGALEQLGCQVDMAIDGFEAASKASDHPYDLIFMDIQMPLMDGISAARAIRANETDTGYRVPIVVLSAIADDSRRLKCLEAGIDDFLTKPARAENLRDILRKHCPAFAESESKKAA